MLTALDRAEAPVDIEADHLGKSMRGERDWEKKAPAASQGRKRAGRSFEKLGTYGDAGTFSVVDGTNVFLDQERSLAARETSLPSDGHDGSQQGLGLEIVGICSPFWELSDCEDCCSEDF